MEISRQSPLFLNCQVASYFYELRSWVQEGEAVFERAADALSTLTPEPEQQILLARLYNIQGIFCNRLSRYTKAVRVLETSLSIARRVDPRRAVHPLANLATTQFLHGAYVEARKLLEESLVIYRQINDLPSLFEAQSSLGYVLCQLGDYSQARALLEQTMQGLKDAALPDHIAFTHCYLGLVAQGEQDTGQAVRSLQTGLAIFRELGHAWGVAACLSSLASVALQTGEVDQVAHLAQEGLTQAKQAGSPYIEALCLNCLGQRARIGGNYAEAKNDHQQAIRIAWENEQLPPVLDGVIGIAELELNQGRRQSAGELLAFAIQHPSTCARERDRARRLFIPLGSQLPPEVISAAKAEKLEDVVEKIAKM